MYYSLIGILAIIVLVISNHDVMFKSKAKLSSAMFAYRNFLYTVAFFYITDIFWGVFWNGLMPVPLFIDTEIFFVAMALGILFLTRYAAVYVEDKSTFKRILLIFGAVFFIGVAVLIILNIFTPIMFYVDEDCGYFPKTARYIVLGFQIMMLVLTSAYAFHVAVKAKGHLRKRYIVIGLFGLVMLSAISIQMFFPLLPLYTIGYMMGCSLMRTFIVENEKNEYRDNLEDALNREQKQSNELITAWKMAYTDALTGAKNKLAYIESEYKIDESITNRTLEKMSLVVFDINGTKIVNDTLGHVAGDKHIVDAYNLINEFIKESSIYRVGGDEFIAILEGNDYDNRGEILAEFHNKIITNVANDSVVIAFGKAEYVPGKDENCKSVLERADKLMYKQKEALKKISIQKNK